MASSNFPDQGAGQERFHIKTGVAELLCLKSMSAQSRWSRTHQPGLRRVNQKPAAPSPADEIGQDPTDNVGAEAAPSQRCSHPPALNFAGQIRHGAQLLAGQTASGSQLVLAIDPLQRKIDELASHPFGLKLMLQR
jgi:hypothetical protein